MSIDDTKFYAPDAAFIKTLAQAAIASLPDHLVAQIRLVALRVQDFVDDDQFDDLGLEDPYELTSLFQSSPDTIWLFRRPILDEWAERGDVCLADLVLHILVHELAAQFVWADAELIAYPALFAALRAAERRLTDREG